MVQKNYSFGNDRADGAAEGFSIAALVADLTPVRPISVGRGLGLVAVMTLLGAAAVFFGLGFRADIMRGSADPVFILRLGTLLLLGTATGYAALSLSRPAIAAATRIRGMVFWKWAIAAAALFPLSALATFLVDRPQFMQDFHTTSSFVCLASSTLLALGIGGTMTLWLRRGAPVNLPRAGLLIGLSAGSFGAAAYSFHCPFSTIAYSGVWFTLAVVISAVIGRAVVPRLIRW